MASDNLASILAGNQLFMGMPAELLAELAREFTTLEGTDDEVIFNEGDPGNCMYLVGTGSVRISKSGRGGQQETLGYISDGGFFGEMALIDGEPRSARATLMAPTTLARLDRNSFSRVLDSAPAGLHRNFLGAFITRLRSANQHFIEELLRTERLSTVGAMANSIIHDLKNPIQVMRSCAELIGIRTAGDAKTADFLRMQGKAITEMLDMIQELLDYARGQSSLQFKQSSAAIVFAEMAASIQRLIPSRIQLVRGDTSTQPLLLDTGRFARVLWNLIKNSVEAMSEGGVLGIGTRDEEDHVVFHISDTGCGIPLELQPRIFEPFVTAGKATGTGLGLAIVKSVVESHRGRITLRSNPEDGTIFEISIPVAKAP